MSPSPGLTLTYPGTSRLHRVEAHVKIVATVLFVLAVVATPREAVWAFALHAALLGGAIALARVPATFFLPRLVVEVPFLVFALALPFVATGPTVPVGPLSLSEAGLWGGWAVAVKGTLGATASLLLAATTPPAELVAGLSRLRVPAVLVQILAFMVRYVDVVVDDLRRMQVARQARAFPGGGIAAWPVLASTAGALFIRSYERGERVHLAMLARGYQGQLHLGTPGPAARRTWAGALTWPAVAALVAALAQGMTR